MYVFAYLASFLLRLISAEHSWDARHTTTCLFRLLSTHITHPSASITTFRDSPEMEVNPHEGTQSSKRRRSNSAAVYVRSLRTVDGGGTAERSQLLNYWASAKRDRRVVHSVSSSLRRFCAPNLPYSSEVRIVYWLLRDLCKTIFTVTLHCYRLPTVFFSDSGLGLSDILCPALLFLMFLRFSFLNS